MHRPDCKCTLIMIKVTKRGVVLILYFIIIYFDNVKSNLKLNGFNITRKYLDIFVTLTENKSI